MAGRGAYNFVLQHIDLGSRIEGIARQDYYELPVKTIREMISNAVCHRSYLTPGKIQVALFDDRLEVTSPGMLDSEITIEKMKSGLSKIRNRGIAAAFSYMNIVEAWGSGIPKMFREAKEYGLREPELIDMGSDFRINLYRKKAAIDQNGVIDPKERDTNDTKVEPNDTNEEAILSIILKNPQATQGAIAKEVEASLSTVKRIMRSLQKSGKLYIANCGCLPENWTLENLMNKHASSPYNPNIAYVFYLAGFIESWGRGIEKICSACEKDGVPQPEYTINPGDIMIKFTAPEDRLIRSVTGRVTEKVTDKVTDTLDETSLKILNLLAADPAYTTTFLAEKLSLSRKTVSLRLKILKEKGLIERIGSDRKGYWKLLK